MPPHPADLGGDPQQVGHELRDPLLVEPTRRPGDRDRRRDRAVRAADRCGDGVHARNGLLERAGPALLAALPDRRDELVRGRRRHRVDLGRPMRADDPLDLVVRQVGEQHPTRRTRPQRQRLPDLEGPTQLRAALHLVDVQQLLTHPHGEPDGLPGQVAQRGHRHGGESAQVDPALVRRPEHERQRPESVAPRRRVLHGQPGLHQCGQHPLRGALGHVDLRGQLPHRQVLVGPGQGVQQPDHPTYALAHLAIPGELI